MNVCRKKGRLSFFIRAEIEPKNRSGVNSLQYDPYTDRLFTAGRDSVIRVWNTKRPSDPLVHTMEHHADWVTDIVLCCGGKNLISASNDTTVKVWNATKGFCMSTLGTHKDYVRVLAYAQHREEVASAGLDGAIFLWDIRTLTALTPTNNTVETRPLTTNDESTYSLAMNSSGTVIVAGGPHKRISVWDPRSRSKPFDLRSHTDSVRALVVRANGEEIISGSSDGTIKIWSLGMQRCTDTIRIHSESVFTLQVNNNWSTVYSAGKDRKIWATDLHNPCHSTLIGEETDPILKLLLHEGQSQSFLWSATCNTNVSRWPIKHPAGASTRSTVGDHRHYSNYSENNAYTDYASSADKSIRMSKCSEFLSNPLSVSLSSNNNGLINVLNHDKDNDLSTDSNYNEQDNPSYMKPDFIIKGGSPIVQFHICPEKRFILTKDNEGVVAVYDVLKASMNECLGVVSFEEEIKKREKLIYVPNWFIVDLKCGMPIIHLDEGDCLSAYINASDAGLLNEFNDSNFGYDTKINYGFILLRSLFTRRLAAASSNNNNNSDNARSDLNTDQILEIPGHTPIILSDGSGRPLDRLLARDASSFSVRLRRCSPEPKWIMEVVESCKLPKPVRIAFCLVPAVIEIDNQGQRRIVPMNSLKRDSLAANDVLLIRKVMEHVFQRLYKLADTLTINGSLSNPPSPRSPGQNDETGQVIPSKSSSSMPSNYCATSDPQTPAMAPLSLPPETLQVDLAKIIATASSDDPNPENVIEIWCGDQCLDPNMNLRSARHFYWKQSGDLVLSYLVTKENSGANNSTGITDDNISNHNSTSTFLINNLHNTKMSSLKEDAVSDSNNNRTVDDRNTDEHRLVVTSVASMMNMH
ncbi:hypothetical protein MN116_007806 [Schistosoma mekongi]|uniref:WD repeat-containing protein 48 n=1 Tax=Schistosoma mekongi TaxID=38744 RepID=A0AAE1Z6Q2_SCHME|nr:hypothetical protein MN116_007806 [Schistosoma mekongi]